MSKHADHVAHVSHKAEQGLLARCACGFEALVPPARPAEPGLGLGLCEPGAAVLDRKPGGGWRCPECLAEPPAIRVLYLEDWRKSESKTLTRKAGAKA